MVMNMNEKLIPCNTNVIIEFYNSNPYISVEKTESGIILGIDNAVKHKSNETGEMINNKEWMGLAKVIAVGPKCENVKIGEDVYVIKAVANPMPYKQYNYWIISEQNILTRILK